MKSTKFLALFACLGFVTLTSCKQAGDSSETESLVSKNKDGTSNLLVTTMITSQALSAADFANPTPGVGSPTPAAGSVPEAPLDSDELAVFNAPKYCWYFGKNISAKDSSDFQKVSASAKEGMDAAVKKHSSYFTRANAAPLSIKAAKALMESADVSEQDLMDSVSTKKQVSIEPAKMSAIEAGLKKAEVGDEDPCSEPAQIEVASSLDSETSSFSLAEGQLQCNQKIADANEKMGESTDGNGVEFCCARAVVFMGSSKYVSMCIPGTKSGLKKMSKICTRYNTKGLCVASRKAYAQRLWFTWEKR